MDMVSGIARTSMEMASTRVATEAQVSVLKNAMNAQKDAMAILLESLGVGGNLNVRG